MFGLEFFIGVFICIALVGALFAPKILRRRRRKQSTQILAKALTAIEDWEAYDESARAAAREVLSRAMSIQSVLNSPDLSTMVKAMAYSTANFYQSSSKSNWNNAVGWHSEILRCNPDDSTEFQEFMQGVRQLHLDRHVEAFCA